MKLGNLEIYDIVLKLSDEIWKIYKLLDNDLKYNIGNQVIRSIDSIGANIAEGYGRFHYKDSVKFYYNVRGSLWESKHWVLLLCLITDLEILGKKLNIFIKTIKNKSK